MCAFFTYQIQVCFADAGTEGVGPVQVKSFFINRLNTNDFCAGSAKERAIGFKQIFGGIGDVSQSPSQAEVPKKKKKKKNFLDSIF